MWKPKTLDGKFKAQQIFSEYTSLLDAGLDHWQAMEGVQKNTGNSYFYIRRHLRSMGVTFPKRKRDGHGRFK